jgi:hypothetical protein
VVDYDYYAAQLPNNVAGRPTNLFEALNGTGLECLVIVDALNQQVRYRLQEPEGILQKLIPTVAQASTGCDDASVTSWTPITPSNLTVSNFTFFISPSENPYAAKTPQTCGDDSDCRWGTICINPTTSLCQTRKDFDCYCTPLKFSYAGDQGNYDFPLHPRVTFSLNVSRKTGQQTVSQTFQTTISSRVFMSLDKLNRYAN